MDKFNEQYTDYTSTAPSDECRHCGRVDNQWTIKVDNSDKLKSDLRKLVDELHSDAEYFEGLDNQAFFAESKGVRMCIAKIDKLLKGVSDGQIL